MSFGYLVPKQSWRSLPGTIFPGNSLTEQLTSSNLERLLLYSPHFWIVYVMNRREYPFPSGPQLCHLSLELAFPMLRDSPRLSQKKIFCSGSDSNFYCYRGSKWIQIICPIHCLNLFLCHSCTFTECPSFLSWLQRWERFSWMSFYKNRISGMWVWATGPPAQSMLSLSSAKRHPSSYIK